MQRAAARVLLGLATHDDNKVKIASLGGIEAVVKAMKAHLAASAVPQFGCRALCNLASSNADIWKDAKAGSRGFKSNSNFP